MHIKCFRVQDFIMKRKKLTILWLILHYFHNKNRNFATVKKKHETEIKSKYPPMVSSMEPKMAHLERHSESTAQNY